MRTTNKCLTLLKSIFNYAVVHGHMVRNPAKGVKALPMSANERRKRVDGAVLTPAQLIAELKRWQRDCPASDWNLVFPTPEGRPESPSNLLNRGLTPALRRAGLRKIRMHDLRHSYASLLIDAGEPLLVVSRIPGHSSINITADTYGHLIPDIVAGVGQRLGDRVFGNSSENSGNFLGTSEVFAPENSEEPTQGFDLFGGPSAARTRDQRIKSDLQRRTSKYIRVHKIIKPEYYPAFTAY